MDLGQDAISFSNPPVFHDCYLKELFIFESGRFHTFVNFLKRIYETLDILRSHSPLLKDYYNTVVLLRTKARFRMMLKYFLYILIILRIDAGVRDPTAPLGHPFYLCLTCVAIFIAYLATFTNPSHRVYVLLSFVLCLSLISIIGWTRALTIRQEHGLYSPVIILVIGMFSFLPLRTPVCLCIAVLYVTTETGLEIFHSHVVMKQPHNLWYADIFKLLHYTNRTQSIRGASHIVAIEVVSWVPVFFIGLYIRFWNTVRNHYALFKLGNSVRSRHECDSALRGQVRWIEAIMPSVIRVEYQSMRQRNLHSVANMWVFNKTYDNVSILFADIVGFTRMSSNKTAQMVVTMLNNLFNRFDELCEVCQCEKIGTLGDCYYCVAGCPIVRPDHAVCCVEMGLGMCRIIKVFNSDFKESVGMRIGVHTGRVNAAIIGAQRFRFDVYSYDVNIAAALESSGIPGRVHISEHTFQLLETTYNFSRGEPLEIRREQARGIAGMELVNAHIETYFVDPRSSLWRTKHERYGQGQAELTSVLDNQSAAPRSVNLSDDEFNFTGLTGTTANYLSGLSEEQNGEFSKWVIDDELPHDVMESLERDMELIHTLQTDPRKQYTLFQNLPLRSLSLWFRDPETEWHYCVHIRDSSKKVYVDSQKMAPMADVLACLVALVLSLVTCLLIELRHDLVTSTFFILGSATVSINIGVCCLISFTATTFEHQIKNDLLRRLYRTLTHPLGHETCLAMITTLPSAMFYLLRLLTASEQVFVARRQLISMVACHCMLIHMLPFSSASWARAICSLITLVALILGMNHPVSVTEALRFCCTLTPLSFGVAYEKFCQVFTYELIVLFVFVIVTVRENEYNCRLCFYVSRESEIVEEEAECAVSEARDLLHNIIPKYVLDQLTERNNLDAKLMKSFNYAVSIPNAGVAFATISNFFSRYYREDYKGGESALKLLNSIVCMFDAMLDRPEMKDVEKVKTVNDCYMVASGLNRDEVKRNELSIWHLISLMNYCHCMIDALDEFNDMYIIGTDKFEIKIGYNRGPLIAGIIGTVKPMYDIWGNTVNVASRMYSTGMPGKIQVPKDVADELSDHFDFIYRGEIFVKGKGNMETYLCQRKPFN